MYEVPTRKKKLCMYIQWYVWSSRERETDRDWGQQRVRGRGSRTGAGPAEPPELPSRRCTRPPESGGGGKSWPDWGPAWLSLSWVPGGRPRQDGPGLDGVTCT